jgi:predicted alpha/beta hydrolase family esterase
LPDNHTPDRAKYEEFLKNSGWDFTDNVLIGHSSGATTVLNLLACDWLPQIKAAILVATFLNERALADASWYEPGQFDNLFSEDGFDPEAVRRKAEKIYFVHGNDDPYCLLEDTKNFSDLVGGKLTVVKAGLHLSANRKELPELIPILDEL